MTAAAPSRMRLDSLRTTALATTVLLSGFDAGSFGPVLPFLRAGLHLDDPHASWLLTAYVLGTLLGNPIFAWLVARAGHGRALGLAVGLYALGAAALAAAPVWGVAFAARFVQGLGGGSFLPLATVSVARAVPTERRGRAVMTLSLGYAVAFLAAAACAPFVAQRSWRSIYVLIAVVGAAGSALAAVSVRFPRVSVPPPLDVRGVALWGAALAALAVAVQAARGGAQVGRGPLATSLLVGAALLAVLARVERSQPHPLLPVRLFRHAVVRSTCALSLAVGCGQVFAVMLPTWAVLVVGVAAPRAGLWSLGFVLAGLAGTAAAATVIDRLGARRVVQVTGALMVVGALGLVAAGASRPWFLVTSAVLGAGMCTLSGGPLRHLLAGLDVDESAPAQALLAMLTNVGLLVASALFGALSSPGGDVAERAAGVRCAALAVTLAATAALTVGLSRRAHPEAAPRAT